MIDRFFEYLRFPSISAKPEHAGDGRACAEWLRSLLASWGLDAAIAETGGAPVVLAKSAVVPGAPTVLLYGHYDVQPVEPLALWETPPFEPALRDGMIFARGATDNKGQTFSHLMGLRRLLDEGPLPVNLTVLIEGEEEIGSPHLGGFVRANRDALRGDVALISDTSMIEPGWPALTLGLRGIACFEVTVHGPRADLHSGMFGGATPNPALALARILARLHDGDGRIAVNGLYDDVLPVPAAERASWEQLPWNGAWFEQTTGIAAEAGEKSRGVLERVWARPTAEINGLTSGHQGPGSKTIIPASARAKLSFRLAPNQDPDRIAGLVSAWFERAFAEEGLRGEIVYDHGGRPFYTPPDDPFIAAARVALAEVFGCEPALTREGLSIPVAALLQRELQVPVVLAGLGLPDCHAHSPNESYPAAHLELGAEAFGALLRRFAGVARRNLPLSRGMSDALIFRDRMQGAGVSEPAIRAFERAYGQLVARETALLPERVIAPVESLPDAAALAEPTPEEIPALLAQCAVLKLNGGLGTSMGLDRAKSLLEVRPGVTFLDLIARQITHFREKTGTNVRFLLMNSFSTSADTRAFLARHPELGDPDAIELLQNKTPKIDAATFAPASWPANPDLEWCPPGHGDLYPVLAGSGALDRLLAAGVRYLFVSNSDNLGATLDPKLLRWFAESGAPFAMEVTARTPSDRKGGHLALRDGWLLLRESAQCPDEDLDAFQDISRHRFFNTNNLWLRLDRLRDALAEAGGFLPLPVIQNQKTTDPRDKKSPAVYQLETAMGAAIECFPDATAIVVPRTRFAPVKTTGDLLTLRSDAYVIGDDGTVQLAPERGGVPPKVDLDDNYKLVDQLEAALADGAPSLKNCVSLKVRGPFAFSSALALAGDVAIENGAVRAG